MSDELLFIIKCIRGRSKNQSLACTRRFGRVITTRCLNVHALRVCDSCPMSSTFGEYPDTLIQLGDYLESKTSSDS